MKNQYISSQAKLKLAGYTVPLLKQQKLLVHNGQNTKVLLIATRQIRVQKSLQIAIQTGCSNWLTQETAKYI